MTLRQTYSCMVMPRLRSITVTRVIFSIMTPTSRRSCSMEIASFIMLDRHACRVLRLLATWRTTREAQSDSAEEGRVNRRKRVSGRGALPGRDHQRKTPRSKHSQRVAVESILYYRPKCGLPHG